MGPNCLGTHHIPCERFYRLDLAAPSLAEIPLEGLSHALILGGITSLKACKENPERSYRCNVSGPTELAQLLLERGIQPVFFSTDYVFDGSKPLYTPDCTPTPLSEYGRQKAELEERAQRMGALVIRMSKVYGTERGDGTLFDQMGSELLANREVHASEDQIFAPIWIGDVVTGIERALASKAAGIIHLAGRVAASRYEMALHLASKLGVDPHLVVKERGCAPDRPARILLESTFPAIFWEQGVEKWVKNDEN